MTSLQVSPEAGTGTTSRRSVPTRNGSNGTSKQKKIGKHIEAMIRADVKKVKQKAFGIRELLFNEYGLAGRHANDVSVDARSGFENEAFEALKDAWVRKNMPS